MSLSDLHILDASEAPPHAQPAVQQRQVLRTNQGPLMTSQWVAFLEARALRQTCRLVRQPGFTNAFYKSDGKGSWRVPFVNESCCIRTNLADLLDAIGAQV